MRNLCAFFTCLLLTTISLAQETSTPITLGTKHVVTSAILKEEMTIQVYAPDGYDTSQEEYPVLFILDGQQYFFSGVGLQKAIRRPRAVPKMIVVGITTDPSVRWTWFFDEKEKFTSFLIDELIPFIGTNYRAKEEHVIFGWEAAAYFVSELVLTHPEAFHGGIATNGGYAAAELVEDFSPTQTTYMYMANSRRDIYNIGETEAFYEILKEHAPQNLVWEYDLINEEIHESLAHVALYKGLRFFYHNYNSLSFESIQQYEDLGGMEYLNHYFEGRAQRFGGDGAIDNSTKNTLIWLAWNRDNFEYFQLFMTEFEDVLSTDRYASAYWQNRFGQFYLKHQDYPNAIKYFNAGLTQYPNSRFEEQMKEGLAEAKRKAD
ncbi:MAG: alpha/beta hydrolase-fold protein [Bacteroidota bacterium]